MRAVDTRPEVVLTEETVQAVVVEAPVLEAPVLEAPAARIPAPRAPVARPPLPQRAPAYPSIELPPSIALPAGTSQVVLAAGT